MDITVDVTIPVTPRPHEHLRAPPGGKLPVAT